MKKLKLTNQVLPGGVVSDVLAGELEENGVIHSVVVKRTRKKVEGSHFSHLDNELQKAAPRTHKLDREILKRLQNVDSVSVPRLYSRHSKGRQTVMENFNSSGYTLMQELLVKGTLSDAAAAQTGRSLANLQLILGDGSIVHGIKPVENSLVQVRERLTEAHVLLYGNLNRYRQLETKLLEGNNLLYTDGHPKNIAVNAAGNIILFDFGRIIRGSSQYPPANFLAHIGLAWIGNTLPATRARKFIEDCYSAYDAIIPIEEKWFVQFFAAELVHRGLAMRWIDPRLFREDRKIEARMSAHGIFLDVFESGCESVAQLFDSLDKRSKMRKPV